MRQAANARLRALVDPAIDALLRALQSAPPCPACGRSDADRDPVTIRACQLVLDRCGFGPTASLNLNVAPEVEPWTAWLTAAELQAVAEICTAAERRMSAGAPPEGVVPELLPARADDYIDAEVASSGDRDNPQAEGHPNGVDQATYYRK